ncbi:MAG: hypothetical protein Q8P50_01490 [Bacillota bacterium]|nr:hypothetical protein [Bacillota bacterium]
MSEPSEPTCTELENARVGYRVGAQLWAYEGQIAWAAFNAMLVANSIVAYAAFSLRTPSWRFWLHVAGFGLCVLWFLLSSRMFSVHNYRVWSTRELEELYLAGQVKTVSRGADYHAGKPVEFRIAGAEWQKPKSLPCRARCPVSATIILVILLFAAIHVASAASLLRIREWVP